MSDHPARNYWRFLRSCDGTAAAEFAFILPLMLVMFAATFEAGRMFWVYNIASTSARDAARYAARLPVDCATNSVGDEAGVKTLAATGHIDGEDPLLPGLEADNVTVAVDCQPIGDFDGRYTGMASVPTITVTVAAPFNALWSQVLPGLAISQISVSNSQVWTE